MTKPDDSNYVPFEMRIAWVIVVLASFVAVYFAIIHAIQRAPSAW